MDFLVSLLAYKVRPVLHVYDYHLAGLNFLLKTAVLVTAVCLLLVAELHIRYEIPSAQVLPMTVTREDCAGACWYGPTQKRLLDSQLEGGNSALADPHQESLTDPEPLPLQNVEPPPPVPTPLRTPIRSRKILAAAPPTLFQHLEDSQPRCQLAETFFAKRMQGLLAPGCTYKGESAHHARRALQQQGLALLPVYCMPSQGGHSCAAWEVDPPPDGFSDTPGVKIPLFWGEGTQVMQQGNHSVFSPETLSQASNFAESAAIDVESTVVELAVTDVAASWTSSAGYVEVFAPWQSESVLVLDSSALAAQGELRDGQRFLSTSFTLAQLLAHASPASPAVAELAESVREQGLAAANPLYSADGAGADVGRTLRQAGLYMEVHLEYSNRASGYSNVGTRRNPWRCDVKSVLHSVGRRRQVVSYTGRESRHVVQASVLEVQVAQEGRLGQVALAQLAAVLLAAFALFRACDTATFLAATRFVETRLAYRSMLLATAPRPPKQELARPPLEQAPNSAILRCEEAILRMDTHLSLLQEAVNEKVESRMASMRTSLQASLQEMGSTIANATTRPKGRVRDRSAPRSPRSPGSPRGPSSPRRHVEAPASPRNFGRDDDEMSLALGVGRMTMESEGPLRFRVEAEQEVRGGCSDKEKVGNAQQLQPRSKRDGGGIGSESSYDTTSKVSSHHSRGVRSASSRDTGSKFTAESFEYGDEYGALPPLPRMSNVAKKKSAQRAAKARELYEDSKSTRAYGTGRHSANSVSSSGHSSGSSARYKDHRIAQLQQTLSKSHAYADPQLERRARSRQLQNSPRHRSPSPMASPRRERGDNRSLSPRGRGGMDVEYNENMHIADSFIVEAPSLNPSPCHSPHSNNGGESQRSNRSFFGFFGNSAHESPGDRGSETPTLFFTNGLYQRRDGRL